MSELTAWQDLRRLLLSQPLAVLGSDATGQPYTSLVAFAINDDLTEILFATTRATRKYRNLTENPKVSLLIDNRSNSVADFHEAMAVTVLGKAQETTGEDSVSLHELFLSDHPHLADFLAAPTSALFCVTVQKYYLVRRFQQVLELTP